MKFCTNKLAPPQDRVGQNLEIISKTFSTNQNCRFMINATKKKRKPHVMSKERKN